MLPCPDYWIGFYFPSYGAKWKKKHTLSLLLKFLERGTFDICCLTEANYYPGGGGGGLFLGDKGVGGNYVVVFLASLICVLNIVPMP